MTEQPSPPITITPTPEQILNLIIQSLFDIPENAQITVPAESITKRINALKAGFVPPETQRQISEERGAFRAIISEVFGPSYPTLQLSEIVHHLSQAPKYGKEAPGLQP